MVIEEPWVEKYRPDSLDKVKDQKMAVRLIKAIAERSLPINLIFEGPAGTGKTSVAKILANLVLGEAAEVNVMEVNASDRVRMDFIRNDLKKFIQQMSIGGGMKIVVMEEADNIPPDAQNALRRLMESSYRTCRFILTCNYISNIIDPIRSRCMAIRFRPVSARGIIEIVDYVLKSEGLKPSDNVVKLSKELRKATRGDMRLVINTLQSCDITNAIESVYDMLGIIKPITMESLLLLMGKNKFNRILDTLNVMDRISPHHFLEQMADYVTKMEMSNEVKSETLIAIADYDERLTLSGSQEVQLNGLIAKLISIMRDK